MPLEINFVPTADTTFVHKDVGNLRVESFVAYRRCAIGNSCGHTILLRQELSNKVVCMSCQTDKRWAETKNLTMAYIRAVRVVFSPTITTSITSSLMQFYYKLLPYNYMRAQRPFVKLLEHQDAFCAVLRTNAMFVTLLTAQFIIDN